MKKSELIEAIATAAGLTKAEAGKALDATFDVIATNVAKGVKVPVAGFGTFTLATRAARQGINPKTKEAITIPARKAVTFKPASALKETINK